MVETSINDPHLSRAWEFVENTGISIFLTGKAGTGKTTFLRRVIKDSAKTAVVVAPTGVAAINAGGVTIHSFFQLSPAPYIPGAQTHDKFSFSKQKLRVIRSLDLLIIDEISMVRADLLDAVDNALRKYRRDPRPFGGVQLLMIGDLQQLAPVLTPSDEAVLRGHYSSPYFFASHALSQIPYVTICLEKVFRQQNTGFISLLNHVRDNALTADDAAMLRSRLDPAFIPPDNSGYIRLTTHNAQADSYNEARMRSLPSAPVSYQAKTTGTFPEMAFPTAERLVLKAGAQVMFIKNDPSGHEYYNGLIGHVTAARPDSVLVEVEGRSNPISVTPQVWENAKYTVNEATNTVETEVQGTFSQIPLRLAWAITIHKSQGLTFDKVVIDAGASFAPGQVYVALSRCRTLEGMVLATPIAPESLRPDPSVAEYITHQAEAASQSNAMLSNIKADYHRQLLVDLFTFRDIFTRLEALYRHVYTNYRRAFAQETEALRTVADRLRPEIIEVSDRWTAVIHTTPTAALTNEEFLARVRKSAVYFYNTLVQIFGNTIQRCLLIHTDNKKANQRVTELATELKQAAMSRLYLLRDINEYGFSVPNYLNFKQQSMLKATRDPIEAARQEKRQATRRKAADKAAKAAKRQAMVAERQARIAARAEAKEAARAARAAQPSTYEHTFRLFRQGLSRDDIAAQRGLTPATISGHLFKLVQAGALDPEEVLAPVELAAIRSVADRLGDETTYAALSAALPGIDYNYMRIALLNHNS